MKSSFKQTIAMVVVLSFLSGCTATIGDPDSSQTTEDAERTKTEGAAFGALLGGLVGAAAGALAGGDNKGTAAAVGFGIGALGGGAAGYMYGKNAAERKKLYASEEDRLDGEIAVLQKYNADLGKQNIASYEQVKKLEKRVADLQSQSKELKKQALLSAKEQQELQKSFETNDKILAKYNQELADLNAFKQEVAGQGQQSETQVASLEKEIDLLRDNIETLDSNNKQMAMLAENLTVQK